MDTIPSCPQDSNPPPEKRCYKCHMAKPLTDFKNNRSRSDGKAAECKKCAYTANVVWNKNRKSNHARRVTRHMRMVGLSREGYDKVHEQQQGVCAICGKAETSTNQHGLKRLAVDHDHATGKFRGLLCQSCNVKLGVLEDRAFVEAATKYLQGDSEVRA